MRTFFLDKSDEEVAHDHDRFVSELLERAGEPVEVCAPARFVARDRFMVNRGGELAISYLGEDFTRHFLGLVEENAGTAILMPRALLKSSIDAPIFAALGGERKVRIALAHLFAFLKTADRARWFFFYVADTDGKLWAVDTYWRDEGWDIEAYSVTYPRGWRSGGCVVSNSTAHP